MAKRVVVTGASSGIGAATVRLFRKRGWDVVGVARRTDRLEALAAETGAEAFTADVTDQGQVNALAGFLAERPVHALVNNAGGAIGVEPIESADPEDWRRMFELNVLGTLRVTQAVLPLLRASWTPGSSVDIVNITSVAGFLPYEGGGGYNASKHAQHALSGVLRLELAGEPIRVTEIAPGLVHTEEFTLNRLGGDQAKADALYADVEPLTAADIAETIVHTVELPHHVSLELVTMRPVAQAAQHKLVRGQLVPKAGN